MIRRVPHLLVLFALLVLPAWAESPAPEGTPQVQAEAAPDADVTLDHLFLPAPLPMGCYSDCMSVLGWPNGACLNVPPAQREQCLSDAENCRCSCPGLSCH